MNKIIPFDKTYKFSLVEENNVSLHPVSNYFFIVNDLSINLSINLKWILWGYIFFEEISKNISTEPFFLPFDKIITDSIQKNTFITKENQHIIYIDDFEVKNIDDVFNLINTTYNNCFFDENSIISIKLKLNLREFLILSHILHPTFIKWSSFINF